MKNIIIALIILLFAVSANAQVQYEIIDLGTLGGQSSSANAINDLGQVAGDSENGVGKFRPFYWDSGIGMIDIDPGPFGSGSAFDINNAGQVVATIGLLWDKTSGAQYLDNMDTTNAINDIGQIAGDGGGVWYGSHATLWESGNVQDLGTLYFKKSSSARGINNLGQVVGESEFMSTGGPYHAFYWDSSNGMIDIGTLSGDSFSRAYAINDFGQVAGNSLSPGSHAFLWEIGSGMQDIGNLGGGGASAKGINNAGQIVGHSSTLEYDQDAFLWDSTSGMINLNDFIDSSGWHLRVANDINENGQIVGFGEHNGATRAFVLTPTVVPEPISSTLFLIGGATLGFRRFRKRIKPIMN